MSRVFIGYEPFGIEGVDDGFIRFIFDVTLGLTTKNMTSEGGVVLVDDDQMQKMNHRYRGKDKTTNVLSFNNSALIGLPDKNSDANYLGDVYISYPVLLAEAEQLNIPSKERFAQLFAHGLLHLLGYDHENAPDTKTMEDLEDQIIQLVI